MSADFGDLDSVHALAGAIDELGPVDVLINNAGIPGPRELQRSAQGVELTFQVNYLAGALLTDLLLPRMPAGARVVNTASATHYSARRAESAVESPGRRGDGQHTSLRAPPVQRRGPRLGAMAHLLGAENLALEYPTKVVFESVTIGIDEGDRIGVVGRNGDGKSTLLRLLAGRQQPDSGRVTRRGGVTIGMLDQGDELPDGQTVAQAVVGDRAEHEWAGDPKIRDVVSGLVGDIPWDARLEELSGGQRRRVALAAVLSRDWDVVFLDEPTNHLDMEGVAWLAAHLKKRWPANQGGLVVVTHDRWFLDEVSTDTWEVHDRIIEPFEGGYAAYVLQRVERDRSAAASESKRRNLMRKELAWLRRGAPARTTKPKFRMDAAAALIANEPPVRDSVSLSQLAVTRLGKDVVDLLGVSVSFDDREVLHDIEWLIAPGERTGILGVNGAGKSTLLGLIAGSVTPTTGRVKRGKTVQHRHPRPATRRARRVRGRAGERRRRAAEVELRERRRRADARSAARTARVHERAALDPGQGPQRRPEAAAAAAADPARRAERAHPRRADQRPRHRHARRDGGPARQLAGHAARRQPRPVPDRAGDRPAVRDPRPTPAAPARRGGGVPEDQGGLPRSRRPRRARWSSSRRSRRVETHGAMSLGGSDRRDAEKELAAIDRRLAKVGDAIRIKHDDFAAHDQSDYQGLGRLQQETAALEAEAATLEERWLELSEALGA